MRFPVTDSHPGRERSKRIIPSVASADTTWGPLASQSSVPGDVRARNRWSLDGFPIRSPTRVSPAPGHHPQRRGGGGGGVLRAGIESVARGPRCVSRSRRNPACFAGWGPRTPASDATTRDPSRTPRVPTPRARTCSPARRSRLINPPCSLPFCFVCHHCSSTGRCGCGTGTKASWIDRRLRERKLVYSLIHACRRHKRARTAEVLASSRRLPGVPPAARDAVT
jgi:hypothetical protein